jgi:hypothetical protein
MLRTTGRPVDLNLLRDRPRSSWPVIDVHVHPLPGTPANATHREVADSLIASADRAGVTRMVLSNLARGTPISSRPRMRIGR